MNESIIYHLSILFGVFVTVGVFLLYQIIPRDKQQIKKGVEHFENVEQTGMNVEQTGMNVEQTAMNVEQTDMNVEQTENINDEIQKIKKENQILKEKLRKYHQEQTDIKLSQSDSQMKSFTIPKPSEIID